MADKKTIYLYEVDITRTIYGEGRKTSKLHIKAEDEKECIGILINFTDLSGLKCIDIKSICDTSAIIS